MTKIGHPKITMKLCKKSSKTQKTGSERYTPNKTESAPPNPYLKKYPFGAVIYCYFSWIRLIVRPFRRKCPFRPGRQQTSFYKKITQIP